MPSMCQTWVLPILIDTNIGAILLITGTENLQKVHKQRPSFKRASDVIAAQAANAVLSERLEQMEAKLVSSK